MKRKVLLQRGDDGKTQLLLPRGSLSPGNEFALKGMKLLKICIQIYPLELWMSILVANQPLNKNTFFQKTVPCWIKTFNQLFMLKKTFVTFQNNLKG